jgi:hypothetical protein
MPDLGEVLKSALSLKVGDRAALAERLLASLDELDEEEASAFGWRRHEGAWRNTAPTALALRRLKTLPRRRKDSPKCSLVNTVSARL